MKHKHFMHRILAIVMVLSLCIGALSMMASASDATNVTDGGYTTGGGAWANTNVKVYNSKVTMTFHVDAQLEGGNWIDFALRGNCQDAGDWFSYQNGLVLRIFADPNWGTYMKVGYGGADMWFDAAYGESALKYTDVDWTQDHTISYNIYDVYEDGAFTGIRVDVVLDGQAVTFVGTSGGDGSYVWIPAASIEAAPAEHFTESYLFAWGNGKTLTVKEAHHETIEINAEPDEPVVLPGEDVTAGSHTTGGGAWANTNVKLHNNTVNLVFNTSAQLEGGNWIDFALRGNEQDSGAWFSYSNGLVLRIYADPTWGTYMKVGYGGGDVWFDAAYGESALKYTDVDWSKDHTLSYSVYDVYENGTFTGIRVDVTLDGQAVTFVGTSGGDGSYVWIPAATIEAAPAEHFVDSFLFVWGNGKTVTVKAASVETIEVDSTPVDPEPTDPEPTDPEPTDPEPSEPVVLPGENVLDGGHTTGGGAWANTNVKIHNNTVHLVFNAATQLEGGNWIDFALRGNEQDPGAWFSYSNGLVLRIFADPNWGTYMKVGYGGGDMWFDVAYGESALKYTDVDWTQDHTLSYSIYDVYENGVFTGIRVDVILDGQIVAFTGTSAGDGSYVWIPAADIETAPAEHFIDSFLFVWGNGKTVNVKAVSVEEIQVDTGSGDVPPQTGDSFRVPAAFVATMVMMVAMFVVTKTRKEQA